MVCLVLAVAGAALWLTWRRLFVGMDLQDESYYVLVPWRWVLGDKPFVHEQNLLQLPGLLVYPFVKLFGLVTHDDPTGIMLYTRHLYLMLMTGVAAVVFLLLRKLVAWPLALLVACVYVTYIYWATPQLSYNTMALAFLSLSLALGGWVVLGAGGRGFAFASGVALGLATVAYPTMLFVVPFWAVLFALAQGRRTPAMIATGAFLHPPDPPGTPTGRPARRALVAWVLGGLAVLLPTAAVLVSFGPGNLWRSWQATMMGAGTVNQLGGAAKAVEVAQGFWRLVTWRPYLLVAALLVYLVYRRWPRTGRALLAGVPVALWLAAQRAGLVSAGFVVIYAFLTVYLYLFIPEDRRDVGARLLIWVWAPSLIAGAMVAYTSGLGYVTAAAGLAPAMMVSGLFLAWALQAAAGPRGGAWPAVCVLAAVVAVTVVFQFQFQQRDVPYGQLTSRFSSGPWKGIAVTPERRALADQFAADLGAQARPGDGLLVFYQSPGWYLYWNGPIVSDAYWLAPGPDGALPQSTISYFRRHRTVPTLAVHLAVTHGKSDTELQAECGGLDYPATLVRPTYSVHRKPTTESTAEVLARLPRR